MEKSVLYSATQFNGVNVSHAMGTHKLGHIKQSLFLFVFLQFGYMKVDTFEKQFLTSGRAISIKMIFPNVSPLMHQIL